MAVGTYKRMFHRWEILRGWIPGIIFTAIVVALEIFYFNYVTARGLADQSYTVPIGIAKLPLSIALFLSLGNAIVLLSLWMTVFENTAYVMTSPDRRARRILYPLRMIRAAALVLAPFTIVLFVPYIVQSNWYISWVSSFTNSVPSLRQTAVNFYNWMLDASNSPSPANFVALQLSAAVASTLVAGLQIWKVKGTRNLMLLLRRSK